MTLIEAVSQVAIRTAKQVLLPYFELQCGIKPSQQNEQQALTIDIKSDGSWLTQADTKAHQMLTEELVKLVDCPVLSEEMSAQEQQAILDKSGDYWCIDPLDGTSNFTQGIPYWCMSIALIQKGQMQLGVIYDPCRDECFSASSEHKTCINGRELATSDKHELKNAMGLIDFKRLDAAKAGALAVNPPYRSQRSFGSSALDLCWIAADRCQVYLHGKQKLWDHAAGLLILSQAGGKAETFAGEVVFSNDLMPKSVIAASNASMMQRWKDYFRTF
ncbi:MAG: inositol monophosphatase family protein [Enterobacterales bacterium]|nr:inositol monophosphatase family protein [Enterobacterales bacterium]